MGVLAPSSEVRSPSLASIQHLAHIYNYLVRYKNPCYLYRDVIFCSTSAAVGLIVRASYWLLGWRIHQTAEVRVAGDLESEGGDTQSPA